MLITVASVRFILSPKFISLCEHTKPNHDKRTRTRECTDALTNSNTSPKNRPPVNTVKDDIWQRKFHTPGYLLAQEIFLKKLCFSQPQKTWPATIGPSATSESRNSLTF